MWLWILNLTLLFLFEIVLLAMIIPRDYLIVMVNTERQHILHWFASDRTTQMLADSQDTFQRLIVDSGFKQGFLDTFYIDASDLNRNDGINKLIQQPEVSWANERIDSFWIILQAIFLRWDLFVICMGLSLLFIIPAIVDGLMNWQKLRSSDENASINIYNVAEKSLYFLAILPVYGLFAPFPITPPVIILWALVIAFCIWLMASNLQHRI